MTFDEARKKLLTVEYSLDNSIKFTWEFISQDHGNLMLYNCEEPHQYYSGFELKKHENDDIEIILTCHGFSFIFPEQIEANRAYFELNVFVGFLKKGLKLGVNPLYD